MALRAALIQHLENRGIESPDVLNAIATVLRHRFVESAFAERAYEDVALPIEKEQTISQPYTVAFQTECLNLNSRERVLEIGTGSGYQCAILCEMGMQVFSIERHPRLYQQAQKLLESMGYKPILKLGDGSIGWSTYAPFDAILVTAACPDVPETLVDQLAPGGRIVLPVGDLEKQIMMRITKHADGSFTEESFDEFRFVPLIGSEGWDDPEE